MARILEVMSAGNRVALICNDAILTDIYGSAGLPIDALRAELCRPDLFQTVQAELMNTYGYQEFSVKVCSDAKSSPS